jgi:hypothetical protein
MRVQGQLEKAQFEALADPAPALTPMGRVYIDTTASEGVPKIHTGSAWRTFKLAQSAALYDNGTTAGKTATINWANGLNQKITLGSHVTLSFTNPVAGEIHTLVVIQKSDNNQAPRLTSYKLNLTDQDSRRSAYQPIGVIPSEGIALHAWFYAANTRAALAQWSSPLLNPMDTVPPAAGLGVDISPDGKYILQGSGTTPFTFYYPFFDNGARGQQYGRRNFVAPTAAAGTIARVRYAPDGCFVFLAGSVSPFINGFFLDRGSPITALANPASLPAGNCLALDVHPSGAFVAVGGTTSPFAHFYPIGNTTTQPGFGTRADPSTNPAAQVNDLAFSPCGDYVAMSVNTSPWLQVWNVDETGLFGSILTNPTAPTCSGASGLGGGGQDRRVASAGRLRRSCWGHDPILRRVPL